MKKGSIVKITKGKNIGKIGMIVYRKSNQEIGVNFNHYRTIMLIKGKCTLNDVIGLGCDVILTKEELESC